MFFQETEEEYSGEFWAEFRGWVKDAVIFIMQDPDRVIQETRENIETAYMEGVERTIEVIKNKAVFIIYNL